MCKTLSLPASLAGFQDVCSIGGVIRSRRLPLLGPQRVLVGEVVSSVRGGVRAGHLPSNIDAFFV